MLDAMDQSRLAISTALIHNMVPREWGALRSLGIMQVKRTRAKFFICASSCRANGSICSESAIGSTEALAPPSSPAGKRHHPLKDGPGGGLDSP
jgi:hypothetical protein